MNKITYTWFLTNGWHLNEATERAIVLRWQASDEAQRRTLLLEDLNHIRWRLLFESSRFPDVATATAEWYDVVIPPPPTPPTIHPNPIRGLLRPVGVFADGAHFEDDGGEVLPVGCSWFGALKTRTLYRVEYQRQLGAIVDAGYQFARVFFAVGGNPFWNGYEIPPRGFFAEDGHRVDAWPDYEAHVIGLGRDFADSGLQVFVTSGDLMNVFGDGALLAQWSRRLGELLSQSGVQVCFADVNEAWQNWVTGSEPTPSEVLQYAIQPFLDGYGKPTIALRSAPFSGETTDGFNLWSGDIVQKHGYRGDYPQDHVSPIRHASGIFYSGDGPIPDKRVGIESEPVGPGASVNTLDNPEALALLAAANFMGGFAYVFHSGSGVRQWLGRIDDEPGFAAVPEVYHYLPPDLQSAYTVRLHGGLQQSPLTDAQGFPGENRVDLVTTADGRLFVGLVYGDAGYTQLQARVPVWFNVITPDTGAWTAFSLAAGQTLDVRYTAGRVVVGGVQ